MVGNAESVLETQTDSEIKEKLDEFIRSYYYNELMKVSKSGEESIMIDFSILDRFDPLLSDRLLNQPEVVLESFNQAVTEIDLPGEQKVDVKITNLPESANIRIRNLRAKHLGKFLTVDCVVKSASEVKPQIYEAVFKCPDCEAKIIVKQDENVLKHPFVCECGRRGRFDLIEKKMFDTRYLSVDEPFEITTGEQPGSISVFLKEDNTSPRMQKKTDPGNNLKLTGIFRELPKRIKGKLGTKMETYIDANHVESAETEFDEIEITPENEKQIVELSKTEKIFENLRESIATGIYGYNEIKDAMVLQLFGGIPHKLPDNSRLRGNIHILITGDPGVGKTRMMQTAARIIPRGKYVSGKGVTGAGLTASVVKNEVLGGWILQAGALVLANKGVIAIDEFDKMNEDDQVAMHEAMSVSTISIAKASIVATLPADTAVLAGANPKLGRFDAFRPVSEQIHIPETLLSRFDLKFALKDKPNVETDDRIAQHILDIRDSPDVAEPIIEPMLLRKYIAYARKIEKVTMTKEAGKVLKDFYNDMRNKYSGEAGHSVAITLRQFEAMIRISEASAKVRLKKQVDIEDAERAINLMKYSLVQLGTDAETGEIDIDRIESGVSTSQRNKIKEVMEMIRTLQKDVGKVVSVQDLKAEAEEQGIGNIDDLLEKLKQEGMVFVPRVGYISTV